MASSLPFFQDAAFDSEMTKIMGEAFDHACASLHDIGQPDLVKEVIARAHGPVDELIEVPVGVAECRWRRGRQEEGGY